MGSRIGQRVHGLDTKHTIDTRKKIDDLDFMETESCLLSEQFLKNEKLGLERGLSG